MSASGRILLVAGIGCFLFQVLWGRELQALQQPNVVELRRQVVTAAASVARADTCDEFVLGTESGDRVHLVLRDGTVDLSTSTVHTCDTGEVARTVAVLLQDTKVIAVTAQGVAWVLKPGTIRQLEYDLGQPVLGASGIKSGIVYLKEEGIGILEV